MFLIFCFSTENFYLPIYFQSIFVYLMEHSYNGCFKVFFSNSNTWVIVELASIHYLFFWELVTFFWFFVYWVILDRILECWILCCEIPGRIEIPCGMFILFVCFSKQLACLGSDCKFCLPVSRRSRTTSVSKPLLYNSGLSTYAQPRDSLRHVLVHI